VRLVSRLMDFLEGRGQSRPELPSRRERRDEARHRHREAGEPLWTDEDRHLGADGEHWVADVAPGTPGHFGSVRSTRDDG
jgi:PAS domain-containing protein